jgi:hypothetical protein
MDDLARLLVERECERLILRYCTLVDLGNASQIADLFCEDGEWIGVELHLRGQDEIRAWFTEREGLARRISRHVCTNILIDVLSEDEAESICFMADYRHDSRDGEPQLPVTLEVPKYLGELHDRFRRTPDGWRFARRRVEVSFVRRRSH